MTDVIEKAVIACKPVRVARQQHLSVAIPPRPPGVLGDPVRLARSFCGLLEKASRSAQMGGDIVVSAMLLNGWHPADESDEQG